MNGQFLILCLLDEWTILYMEIRRNGQFLSPNNAIAVCVAETR